ncbi:MAG TPA: hypothetical protein V6D00_10400 [Pantanalinema sp.]
MRTMQERPGLPSKRVSWAKSRQLRPKIRTLDRKTRKSGQKKRNSPPGLEPAAIERAWQQVGSMLDETDKRTSRGSQQFHEGSGSKDSPLSIGPDY